MEKAARPLEMRADEEKKLKKEGKPCDRKFLDCANSG